MTGRFQPGCVSWRAPKEYYNKDWLYDQYVVKKRSTGEIAMEMNVTDSAVIFYLKKHGIERRNVSEARAIKKWGVSGEDNPMFGKVGPLNPNYVDGSSPERQSMYAQSFWKQLIKSIFLRDGYKCQRCFCDPSRKNKLNAHHLASWAGNPLLRFIESNLITLCHKCHQWVHSKRNVNKEFLA